MQIKSALSQESKAPKSNIAKRNNKYGKFRSGKLKKISGSGYNEASRKLNEIIKLSSQRHVRY